VQYLIFLTIFVVLADWSQIWLFVEPLIKPSVKKIKLKNKEILRTIKEKSGLHLNSIIVIESEKMYGGMSGIPGRPQMILSSKLIKTLDKGELEYVLLHEAAHFKYSHPVILGISQIALIGLGIYLVREASFIITAIIGVTFGLFFIQIARITERAAENFSASHMSDPKYMLGAVNKFEKEWSNISLPKLRKLLSWNISYKEKRKIAMKYV